MIPFTAKVSNQTLNHAEEMVLTFFHGSGARFTVSSSISESSEDSIIFKRYKFWENIHFVPS